MSWKNVLGHDFAVASFSSAWQRGRLGHAYLFVGPRGVGKHTFARELAKTLLCEGRGDKFDACDACDSCIYVNAGTHPDLFMVCRPEDKLEFPISVIREELLPNLAMKPGRGGRKVAILDDADDLNEEAANCFLKTLEEPPPGSVLILVGGMNAEVQLPTILSRCQVIRFAPLAPAMVARILADNGITDKLRQDRILQLASGSPGQALALEDDAIWEFRQQLLNLFKREKLDPVEVSKEWMQFIENAGKDPAAHRNRASLIFRLLIVLMETSLKLSMGATLPGLDPAEEQTLRKLGERLGENKLLSWIERALEADLHVDRRVQLVLTIEAFVDAMCRG